ncbi:GNAT family N-acetyltransferase [Plantactinospora sonchi]|uniref:N-acetyltransferase family protein n=1 Tax=Plantactinospora sonchi TaxID=1544735 RepID=A0ABU7RYQ6_9ACTN
MNRPTDPPLPKEAMVPTRDPEITPATAADLAAITDIYAHYVTGSVATFDETPPDVDHWRQRLADLTGRGLPFLVARVDGLVAGYAYAGPYRPKPAYRHTVEDTIYLAPGRAGQGLGRALLGALLPAARSAGARQMVAVIADTGSDASAALHRRFGFVEVGRLVGVGYKHDRWIDTVLMQRDLSAGPA